MTNIDQPQEFQPSPAGPSLTLKKSFNKEDYPAGFEIKFYLESYFDTPKADKLFSDTPANKRSWLDFKKMMYTYDSAARMQQKERDIRDGFSALGIVDYHISVNDNSIYLRFRDTLDAMKAASIVIPDHVFNIEFLTFPDDVPDNFLAAKAEQIQKLYNDTDPADVKLTQLPTIKADFKTHQIQARTKAIDIPIILEHAEQFTMHFNSI